MFMQSLHWSGKHSLSQHPHMSSQHNKNMTIANFDIVFTHPNHLQVA